MKFGHRFLLSIFIVLVMIFALSLCGYNYWEPTEQKTTGIFDLMSAESQPVELPLCMDDVTREQIKTVMLEALDNALKNHIEHVFEIWLRDERGQPARAKTGVTQGVKAYIGARKAALDWAPPLCSG